MTFKSKYKIGDRAWVIFYLTDKIDPPARWDCEFMGTIKSVAFSRKTTGYELANDNGHYENAEEDVFRTKREALRECARRNRRKP